MDYQRSFERDLECLTIRSETSYSEIGLTKKPSIDSLEAPDNDFSTQIQGMIEQEKQKNGIVKVDNRAPKENIVVKTKRMQSQGSIKEEKPTMKIPKNVEQLLDSSKKYPNVPVLQQKSEFNLNTIYGAFFGFLIGDVVGSYMAYNSNRNYEYLIPNALMMNGGGTYGLGAGQGSDQTQMMFSLCYALIEGQGTYNRNIVARYYLQWFQSKPFNFSAVIALALRDIRKMNVDGVEYDPKKIGKIVEDSSLKNANQQSSIGFLRVLPLALFGLKFNETDYERLIKDQLSIICPNPLVIQSGIVYGKLLRNIFLSQNSEQAFYKTSKWVYDYGSQKLLELWKAIQKGVLIPSRGNLGKLKTSFTYAFIEASKPQKNFIDSLVRVLEKGGDSEITCSVVMSIIGAMAGYKEIPGYFKQKIVNSSLKDSPRPRNEIYAPSQIFSILQKLMKVQNQRLFSLH